MKKKMLSAALLLAALLCLCAAATAEATATNVWKDSDIREFLNNGAINGDADSTDTVYGVNSTNDSGYAAHFTDAEYGLMLPTQVNTLTKVGDSTQNVTTTDRIFLPSGVTSIASDMNVLSWGQKDLTDQYNEIEDYKYLIPLGYWAASNNGNIWLRSAMLGSENAKSYARTQIVVQSAVNEELSVAPVFMLNPTNILFASCASAADLAGRTPQSIEIEKSEYLGSRTDMDQDGNKVSSPTYGMYLKTKYPTKEGEAEIDFRVRNLSYSEKELSFEYAGGMPGDYVMIQAYVQDDFDPTGDPTVRGYVAAMPITKTTVCGEMSVDMSEDLKRNMADYTFKIWMENPSRVSLAQATRPQTFSFKSGYFVEVKPEDMKPEDIGALPKNLRMFAMKDELTCSWGDLSKLNNLKSIVAGGVHTSGNGDSWVRGKSCGVNPSNQIIYFGVDKNDKPLRFWIAGHGTTTINSETVPALTLYQVYSDDKYRFDGAEESELQIVLDTPKEFKPGVSFTVSHNGSAAVKFVSTNPHVAEVEPNGTVTIKDYGEFSIVLFSGNQILQTQTFSVVNSDLNDYNYNPAGDWPKDETEDDGQPEQPGQAVQDAAGGLPQTGDSSAAPLWAALLALSLAGLMARRRRSA